MSKIKSKVRIWRRDAFNAMLTCLPEQEGLPWYQERGLRLKYYVDTYFDALDGVGWDEIDVQSIKEVYDYFKEHAKGLDGPFLVYVGELLLAAKGVGEPRLFQGLNLKCDCGGTWSLSRETSQVKDWCYQCNCCDLKSKVDISGLPISLPAPRSVRNGRSRLHKQLMAFRKKHPRIVVDDIYSLLSYYTSTPLGYVHFGYLQTDAAVETFSRALSQIERDVESVSEGASVRSVLHRA